MTPQQPRQGEKHYEGDVGHGVLVPVELRIQHQREEAREEDRLAFAARAPAERAQDQSGEQAPACGNEQAPRGDRVVAVSDEVAIVREGLAGSAGGEGLGPLAAQLSDRLQGLTDRLAAVEERSATLSGIAERVGALEQRPETDWKGVREGKRVSARGGVGGSR